MICKVGNLEDANVYIRSNVRAAEQVSDSWLALTLKAGVSSLLVKVTVAFE